MIEIDIGANEILKKLNKAGYEAYVVGGCVRDAILGKTPFDWDITTNASPENILFVFRDDKTIPTGIKHGTVTVKSRGNYYEVTTYRKDGKYADHRRPDNVYFIDDIAEDLKRRDFTVNAMAYNPDEGLVDLFGGKDDINNKLIRAVGDPYKRFDEDALRIMRAVRFSSTLGFDIDNDTYVSALELKHSLHHVSGERIYTELTKMLMGKAVFPVMKKCAPIIFEIIPELADTEITPQNTKYHLYDVWTHTLKTIENAPNDITLRLTMLFHDAGKPAKRTTDADGTDHFKGHSEVSEEIAARVLRRLHSDNKTIDTVCTLIRYHECKNFDDRYAVLRLFNEIGPEMTEKLFSVKYADAKGKDTVYADLSMQEIDNARRIAEELINEKAVYSTKQLSVNGNDLKTAGLKAQEIGSTLKCLLDSVMHGEIGNEKNELLDAVRRYMNDVI